MTLSEIKKTIDELAREYKGAEDEWHYENLELKAVLSIFEYMEHRGVEIDGLDLRKFLDAEDDPDDGVPEDGIYATTFELANRIVDPSARDPIPVPAEVKDLFSQLQREFDIIL